MHRTSVISFWAANPKDGRIFEDELLEFTKSRLGVAGRLVQVPDNKSYAVSDDGRIFTCKPCVRSKGVPVREMKQTKTQFGHLYVRMAKDGKPSADTVHRIVAKAFLPPPLPGQTLVRHLDGNPGNNRVDNLKWGTQSDNMQDCVRHGRTLKGLKNSNAKLTDDLVKAAIIFCKAGYSYSALAQFLGVSPETVRRAVTGEQWGHVNG